MKQKNLQTSTIKSFDHILDSIAPVEQSKVDAKMILAARIQDAIKSKNWQKKDLMKAVKKRNPSIITKWLSGTQNFTIDTLVELEHALDIKLLNNKIF
jgi:ribosome-binding protein aMBF1 (putative translation factor)